METRIELECTDDEFELLIDEFAAHCTLYGAIDLTVIGEDGRPIDIAPLLPPGFAVRAGRIVTELKRGRSDRTPSPADRQSPPRWQTCPAKRPALMTPGRGSHHDYT